MWLIMRLMYVYGPGRKGRLTNKVNDGFLLTLPRSRLFEGALDGKAEGGDVQSSSIINLLSAVGTKDS